ncbi:MAG: hypothetical protein SFV52_12600 [Saprospiraceae bacterium]|nr:hypothetical protein [Saprospiraceae bacterium]
MKPSFLTTQVYLVVLSLLVATMHLQCTGQQPPNPADSTQVQPELVRPPRTYGAYTLRWDRYTRGFYRDTITIDTVQFIVEEQAPGILVFDPQWPFPGLPYKKIEYYDTATHVLLKTVDLEALSPYYNGQYPGVTVDGIDIEYMILPEEPDSNCVFSKLPPPQYYSTYNDIRLLSDAGYYKVGNYLIGYRKENTFTYVVSWESTVIILNPQGEEVLRINPDYTFYAALVTADGRYLCVSYGGRQQQSDSSPFDPCAAYFDLYDMQEDKRLMHYLGMNKLQGITPGYMKVYANGMIYSYFEDYGDPNTGKRLFEQLIFDPYRREVRIYNIGEDMSLHPQNNVNTLMETMPHKLRKF